MGKKISVSLKRPSSFKVLQLFIKVFYKLFSEKDQSDDNYTSTSVFNYSVHYKEITCEVSNLSLQFNRNGALNKAKLMF